MTLVTRRLTAKNRDQLRNRTLGIRVWATFTFTLVLTELWRFGTQSSCVHVRLLLTASVSSDGIGNERVPKITITGTINLLLKLQSAPW